MAKKITDSDEFNPATQYLPDGSLKNRVYDGDDILEEGTEVVAEFVQDLLNPFHKMGRILGQFLNGVADNQTSGQFMAWLMATILHSGSRNFTALTANNAAYELAGDYSPLVYKPGLTVQFVAPSANTGTTATVSINGIGAVPVSDAYFTSGSAAVKVGAWSVGDVVTLRYDITPTPHFRIVKTPLDMLSGGTLSLSNTSGGIGQTLAMALGRIALGYSASSAERLAEITPSGMALSTTSPGGVKSILLDMVNGRIKAASTSTVWTNLATWAGGKGLQFEGGPWASITDAVRFRALVINVPLATVLFTASTRSPADWVMNAYAGGTYTLDTGLPSTTRILGAYANYTDQMGVVRGAPVGFDADAGTGNWHDVTIHSGDAPVSIRRPQCVTSGDFLVFTIWYDGASLT